MDVRTDSLCEPYLNHVHIDTIRLPLGGETLTIKDMGSLDTGYLVVMDPAAKQDAFAWPFATSLP